MVFKTSELHIPPWYWFRRSLNPPGEGRGVRTRVAGLGLAWDAAKMGWGKLATAPGITASWTMSAKRGIDLRGRAQKSAWRPLEGANPDMLCPEDLWTVPRETRPFGTSWRRKHNMPNPA